jgi:preprotein translocase subunit SecG
MKIFLTIIFLVVCVALTAIVLMQEGKAAGLGSIGGLGDTYWGKNKSKSMEGTLVRVTKLLAAAFLIIALALNMIPDKSSSKNNTPVTEKATEAVTEAAAAQTEAEAVMTEAEAAVQTEAEAVMTEAEAAVQTEAEAVMTEAEAAAQTEAEAAAEAAAQTEAESETEAETEK